MHSDKNSLHIAMEQVVATEPLEMRKGKPRIMALATRLRSPRGLLPLTLISRAQTAFPQSLQLLKWLAGSIVIGPRMHLVQKRHATGRGEMSALPLRDGPRSDVENGKRENTQWISIQMQRVQLLKLGHRVEVRCATVRPWRRDRRTWRGMPRTWSKHLGIAISEPTREHIAR